LAFVSFARDFTLALLGLYFLEVLVEFLNSGIDLFSKFVDHSGKDKCAVSVIFVHHSSDFSFFFLVFGFDTPTEAVAEDLDGILVV